MRFPEQFSLLAQGSGFEDWANILFLVVMAGLWLLAGLIKTIGKRRPQQERQGPAEQLRQPSESWQERLVRKAQELQRRLEEEAGVREPEKRRPPARTAPTQSPQAPGGKITVRPGQRGDSVVVYERPQSHPSTQREHQVARQREAQRAVAAAGQYTASPKLEPIRRESSEPTTEGLPPVAPPEPAGFETTAIIDYSDTDALKKAILHYEILGKPLALRDTPDQTSVF